MNSFTLVAWYFEGNKQYKNVSVFSSFVASLVPVQTSLFRLTPLKHLTNEQVLKLLLNYLNSDTILFPKFTFQFDLRVSTNPSRPLIHVTAFYRTKRFRPIWGTLPPVCRLGEDWTIHFVLQRSEKRGSLQVLTLADPLLQSGKKSNSGRSSEDRKWWGIILTGGQSNWEFLNNTCPPPPIETFSQRELNDNINF